MRSDVKFYNSHEFITNSRALLGDWCRTEKMSVVIGRLLLQLFDESFYFAIPITPYAILAPAFPVG
jgi:hypothetical protein